MYRERERIQEVERKQMELEMKRTEIIIERIQEVERVRWRWR